MKQIKEFFLESESPTLKISQYSHENTYLGVSFLIKLQANLQT